MILVAGEALIDLVVGPDGDVAAHPGGGPYTTARTIGRLGGSVAFLGRLSTDGFGRRLGAGLAEAGVHATHIVTTDDPTTLAVAELDPTGAAAYRFYVDGTSVPGLREGDVAPLGADVQALHVGTLGLALEPIGSTLERLALAADRRVLVMLDVNARPTAVRDPGPWRSRIERVARRADVVKASVDDLAFLRPGIDPGTAAAEVLELGARVLLVTDGARPTRVVTPRGSTVVPGRAIRPVDTVGAGDAFGGGFLASFLGPAADRTALDDDRPLMAAVTRAVDVAAMTCTRRGADPPTAAELAAWVAAR